MSSPVATSGNRVVTAQGKALVTTSVSDTTMAHTTLVASRLAGNSRFGTAIEASKRAFSSPMALNSQGRRAVVVANAYGYADALPAAALAGAVDAPLLLVKESDVPADVAAHIKNYLQADYAYIVGGSAVIDSTAFAELESIVGVGRVDRVYGSNRFGTALDISREVNSIIPKAEQSDTVFLATGYNYPDALAASSLAAHMNAPILLTRSTRLPSETDKALRELRPKRVVVCGGDAAVGPAVYNAIQNNAAYGSPVVERMNGANRTATARMLAEWGVDHGLADSGVDGVFIATGWNYPDALAGGPLAGKADGVWRPLVLTKATSLHPDAAAVITDGVVAGHVGFITVLGGPVVVPDSVMNSALSLVP